MRPWGDVAGETSGIIVYAEHLNKAKPRTNQPLTTQTVVQKARARGELSPSQPLFGPSNLIARGILWAREGRDAMQRLVSSYREMSCTCKMQASEPGHQPNCAAHATVPLIVQSEQAIRRLCRLEDLLRMGWTLIN